MTGRAISCPDQFLVIPRHFALCVGAILMQNKRCIFCEGRVHATRCHRLVGRLTRFRLCDRHCEHYKANTSITQLKLQYNRIGDDGATALAETLKATLVEMLRH